MIDLTLSTDDRHDFPLRLFNTKHWFNFTSLHLLIPVMPADNQLLHPSTRAPGHIAASTALFLSAVSADVGVFI